MNSDSVTQRQEGVKLMFKSRFKYILFVTLFYIGGLLPSCSPTGGKVGDEYKVLIVHTYSPERCAWVHDLGQGIESCIRDRQARIDTDTLYLNFTDRSWQKNQDTLFQTLERYGHNAPDLIVVCDDEATLALLECSHPLADSVPVVFNGVDYIDREHFSRHPNFTGFMTTPNYDTIQDLAFRLFDNVICRCALVDTSRIGLMAIDMDSLLIKDYPGLVSMNTMKYHYDTNGKLSYTLEETRLGEYSPRQFISSHYFIPEKELGVYMTYSFSYRPNKYFLMTHWNEYYSLLLQLVDLNYLSVQNEGFGQNVLGGYFCSSYDQGYQAMDRGIRILHGASPRQFTVEASPKKYYFDWKVMQKWHIMPEELPVGSVIVNMPFRVRYQTGLIVGGSILGAILLFIVGGLARASYREARKKKNLYRTLRKKERELSITINTINEAIVSIDRDKRILKMNRAAILLLPSHMPEKEYIGKPLHDYFNISVANQDNQIDDIVDQVARDGQPHELNPLACLINVNGDSSPVSGMVTPIMQKGVYTGCILSFRNTSDEVTNQRFIELGITMGGSFSWRFEDNLDSMVFDKDFYTLMNIPTPGEGIDHETFKSLIHPEDVDSWLTSIVQTDESIHRVVQLRLNPGNDEYQWFEFQVGYHAIRKNGNYCTCPYGLCSGIDELKKQEQQLRNILMNAEKADKQKTLFLQSMSHEIRTPLNAIVGFSSLLNEEELSEEEKLEFTTVINSNCDLLMNIINTILEISRIENGVPFRNDPFSLNRFLEQTVEQYRPSLPPGVTLELVIPASDVIFRGDELRLAQVMEHLINNAIKFTKSEGRITIQLEDQADYISLYIKDSGIGIAPENLDKIFDRFFRVNDFVQGTGLGLALCQEIVRRMKGAIHATSEMGKGTVFQIILPREFPENEKGEEL